MKKIRFIFPLFLMMFFFLGCDFSFKIQPDKYYKAYFYCQDTLVETVTLKENEQIMNIDESKILTIEGYQFIGWDIDNDDEVDELPIITSNIEIKAIYRADRKYLVSFYLDNQLFLYTRLL